MGSTARECQDETVSRGYHAALHVRVRLRRQVGVPRSTARECQAEKANGVSREVCNNANVLL